MTGGTGDPGWWSSSGDAFAAVHEERRSGGTIRVPGDDPPHAVGTEACCDDAVCPEGVMSHVTHVPHMYACSNRRTRLGSGGEHVGVWVYG